MEREIHLTSFRLGELGTATPAPCPLQLRVGVHELLEPFEARAEVIAGAWGELGLSHLEPLQSDKVMHATSPLDCNLLFLPIQHEKRLLK